MRTDNLLQLRCFTSKLFYGKLWNKRSLWVLLPFVDYADEIEQNGFLKWTLKFYFAFKAKLSTGFKKVYLILQLMFQLTLLPWMSPKGMLCFKSVSMLALLEVKRALIYDSIIQYIRCHEQRWLTLIDYQKWLSSETENTSMHTA